MPKATADLVALILAAVVAIVVTLTAITLLWLAATGQERDVSNAADAIGRIISVLVGALVGYMAGRKVNGNGGS
jgi:hypothetical protein